MDKLQKLYELKKAEKLLKKHKVLTLDIKEKLRQKGVEYGLDKNK